MLKTRLIGGLFSLVLSGNMFFSMGRPFQVPQPCCSNPLPQPGNEFERQVMDAVTLRTADFRKAWDGARVLSEQGEEINRKYPFKAYSEPVNGERHLTEDRILSPDRLDAWMEVQKKLSLCRLAVKERGDMVGENLQTWRSAEDVQKKIANLDWQLKQAQVQVYCEKVTNDAFDTAHMSHDEYLWITGHVFSALDDPAAVKDAAFKQVLAELAQAKIRFPVPMKDQVSATVSKSQIARTIPMLKAKMERLAALVEILRDMDSSFFN